MPNASALAPSPALAELRHCQLLDSIEQAEEAISRRFEHVLRVDPALTRSLVSFQANKTAPCHRWFRFKEGFSAALVDHLFEELGVEGPILDPFAGVGTTLHVASQCGIPSVGVELLPAAVEAIQVRRMLQQRDGKEMAARLRQFAEHQSWERAGPTRQYAHLRTTMGAFWADNQYHLERFLSDAQRVDDPSLGRVLRFAAMCVLETVSYTSKDGQFLRWDCRSGKRSPFRKPAIRPFTEAIRAKLQEIADDLSAENCSSNPAPIDLRVGSCLEVLPRLPANHFGGLVTSPPYCNRYDYTRTYALELALLGVNDVEVARLRQRMLTATVEQRPKEHLEAVFGEQSFERATAAYSSQELLSAILEYLRECQAARMLNNRGIVRMIENYFREMALVVVAAARVLRPGAPLVMVNDNVRYQGVHIPVDLILADFAEAAGLEVEAIWMLPHGKGNSSQQMGRHGRQEVRKCVYVWRKPRQ
jgi:hypothetical protein